MSSVADASPSDTDALVCARCGRTPRASTLAWSDAAGTIVHVMTTRRAAGTLRRVCGGMVAARAAHWQDRLAPGGLAACLPARAGLVPHIVRLGRRVNARNLAWSGTPLCGKTYAGPRRWVPLPEQDLGTACPACRAAAAAEDEAFPDDD